MRGALKIVFANNFHYVRGGSERVYFDEMKLLAAKGQDVAAFSRQFDKNIDSEYSRHFPPPMKYDSVPLPAKIRTAFEMIYSSEAGRRFGKLVSDFRPDILHAHNIYGRLSTSILDTAAEKGIPAVMTLHDYKLICPSYLMLRSGSICELCTRGKYYKCLTKRCHKGSFASSLVYAVESYYNRFLKKYESVKYFICPSRFILEKHAVSGVHRDKLVYLPNFIDTDVIEPNYAPGGYVLYCGRLSSEKGIMTLLAAVKGLDLPVKIVGDGPLKEQCEKYVSDNEMNNVAFEGYKSGGALEELYRRAAFLVFPSEWYENAPMSVLEAFAYGKPVIGSNIGGVPEMVVDGDTGFLFKPGDSADLKAKLQRLFENASLMEEMGRKARARIEEEVSSRSHYAKLIDIYDRAMK